MRILVTGGYGFIGAHALTQLAGDHDVAVFDIADPSPVAEPIADRITDISGDVTDPIDVYDAVASFEPDRIVDLASLLGRESHRHPRRALEVNLGGSLNVLDAAAALGVERVVAASSVSAYGRVTDAGDRLDETAVQRPEKPYGVTKFALERFGQVYAEQRDIEFVALEPVHGLGPHRVRGNVEDAVIVQAAVAGEHLVVPRIEHPFEIIYVEDEARAFVEAVLADSAELAHTRYLVGSGERTTIAEFSDLVQECIPGADLEPGDARGDDGLHSLPPTDTSRLRAATGWETEHSIRDAVESYAAWLEANPEAWSFDPDTVPWPTDR
jgi:nucleoside-diphosphate-sugar epimerase